MARHKRMLRRICLFRGGCEVHKAGWQTVAEIFTTQSKEAAHEAIGAPNQDLDVRPILFTVGCMASHDCEGFGYRDIRHPTNHDARATNPPHRRNRMPGGAALE